MADSLGDKFLFALAVPTFGLMFCLAHVVTAPFVGIYHTQ
jgi:hypothetical protein